jgi:rubredoxin
VEEESMDKYDCPCGYVYNPEEGDHTQNIGPETAFEDLPEDWLCPTCQAGKDIFTEVE